MRDPEETPVIFEAMQDAARRGCRNWNWGGTWLSQGGVYDFKSRWGARDVPYHYYVRLHARGAALARLSREELLAEYPYFYVLPFSALESTDA